MAEYPRDDRNFKEPNVFGYRKRLYRLGIEIARDPTFFNEFTESIKDRREFMRGKVQNLGHRIVATLKTLDELERCGVFKMQENEIGLVNSIPQDSNNGELANTPLDSMEDSNVHCDYTTPKQQNQCLYLRNEEISDVIPDNKRILDYAESRIYKQTLENSGLIVKESNMRRYEQMIESLQVPQTCHEYVVVMMIGYRHWNQKLYTVLMNGPDNTLTQYYLSDMLCDLKKIYSVEKIIFIHLTIPLADEYPDIQPPKRKNSNLQQGLVHIHINVNNKETMRQLLTPEFTENWVKSRDIIRTIHESTRVYKISDVISYVLPFSIPELMPRSVLVNIITNQEQTEAIERYFSGNFVPNITRCNYRRISCDAGKITSACWDKLKKKNEARGRDYDMCIYVITSKRPVSTKFHFQTVEACNMSSEESMIQCPKIFIIDAPLSNQSEQICLPEITKDTLIIGSYSDCNNTAIACLGQALAANKGRGIDFKSQAVQAIRDGGRAKLDFRSNLDCSVII